MATSIYQLSRLILDSRTQINTDLEYKDFRRRFNENYEWLRSFWLAKFNEPRPKKAFSHFYGNFFWQINTVRNCAKIFANLEPIGNANDDFNPSLQTIKATYHLKYNAKLVSQEVAKIDPEEKKWADLWTENSFSALMNIISQIKLNLFVPIPKDQRLAYYQEAKLYTGAAVKLTDHVLDYLIEAEDLDR